jgi:hypothetical protein
MSGSLAGKGYGPFARRERPCCRDCQMWAGRHGAYCKDAECACHDETTPDLELARPYWVAPIDEGSK